MDMRIKLIEDKDNEASMMFEEMLKQMKILQVEVVDLAGLRKEEKRLHDVSRC